MSDRAKDLAAAHWDGYVSPLICNHADERRAYTFDEVLRMCKYHYITAAVHFHGHGVEDERNGLFRPIIGEDAPQELNLTTLPDLCPKCKQSHCSVEPKGNVRVCINFVPNACVTCLDAKPCGGALYNRIMYDCLHHRPRG